MTARSDQPDAEPIFDEAFRRTLTQLLAWRRDVRSFDPRPVDPAALAAALSSFDLAPSVGNSQPWRLVTVNDPERRVRIRDSFERSNASALRAQATERAGLYASLKLAGLDQAPVHLAVFCDEDCEQGHGLGTRTMPETLAYSTVAALTTFWLAARAHGIGVGWVSIIEPDVVSAVLDVPAEWRLIAYLCVGYPAAADDVPDLERRSWQARAPLASKLIRR
ncbi:5,6-dimethylbenzimidazole synthase [Mangrovicella endophytica]|uniref:5,6-dimethylbenzimidazole synthase n=1 Tax=Mangrovicella endophytica TaxID=2066697 RepID=UPI000C9EA1D0|nr:5,6-dimethylbenzimidazole synthase [Mangrovicella endophytica]